jgi:hypothetical protein
MAIFKANRKPSKPVWENPMDVGYVSGTSKVKRTNWTYEAEVGEEAEGTKMAFLRPGRYK